MKRTVETQCVRVCRGVPVRRGGVLLQEGEVARLLLLDEPETSLHPGAQVKLQRYILDQIKKKHLQVVISTHAPAFAPPE